MLINVVTALIAYAALAVFIQLPSFNTYAALLWVQSSIILCNALGQSGTLPPQKITCILPSAH